MHMVFQGGNRNRASQQRSIHVNLMKQAHYRTHEAERTMCTVCVSCPEAGAGLQGVCGMSTAMAMLLKSAPPCQRGLWKHTPEHHCCRNLPSIIETQQGNACKLHTLASGWLFADVAQIGACSFPACTRAGLNVRCCANLPDLTYLKTEDPAGNTLTTQPFCCPAAAAFVESIHFMHV